METATAMKRFDIRFEWNGNSTGANIRDYGIDSVTLAEAEDATTANAADEILAENYAGPDCDGLGFSWIITLAEAADATTASEKAP